MNMLEHYIVEIHSVKDVTDKFNNDLTPYLKLKEPLLEVDLTVDCYGDVRRTVVQFPKSKFESIKEKGYYMA